MISYAFNGNEDNFDYLAQGESVTLTYVITLADQILQLLPNQSEELQSQIVNEDDPSRLMVRMALASPAGLAIVPAQDLLGLGSGARPQATKSELRKPGLP